MRILKYFYISIFLVAAIASPARAQVTYTSPQTIQQTFNGSCTGSAQNFSPSNIGQTQHLASITVTAGVTNLQMAIQGVDNSGNAIQISDTVYYIFAVGPTMAQASGYYPKLQIQVICNGGNFVLNYSGASATPIQTSGTILQSQLYKPLVNGASAGAAFSTTFATPQGSSGGYVEFHFGNGAGPVGSTLSVGCGGFISNTGSLGGPFALATPAGQSQRFYIPAMPCLQLTVAYTNGGASGNLIVMSYTFAPAGFSASSSTADQLSAALNTDATLTEKGARWPVISTPAAGTQATASKAAGAAGVRHVADCVSLSAGAIAAPAATQLQVSLRDGASGAGTVLWAMAISIPATTGPHYAQNFCGLNLIGTAATAMTLEFNAGLASESESVTLTGYDVQ